MRTDRTHIIRRVITSMFIFFVVLVGAFPTVMSQESSVPTQPEPISAQEIAAAQQFGQTLGIADWLGPLAPVALSPFFGITLMSGFSLFGQEWIDSNNALLGAQSPLHNPILFWAFLILTAVTSIPRFTKVSKPVAQAIDQVESWAGIITLIIVRLAVQTSDAEPPPIVQAGIVSLGADTLLIVAAAVNIFVISSVRFFFEILIWITPVPTVDAIFEFFNKSICAVLMLIYGYSPMTAMFINLGILAASLVVFRWVYRRQVFFRCMIIDALLHLVFPVSEFVETRLEVFPERAVGPFKARDRCLLTRTEEGWLLERRRFLRGPLSMSLPVNESSSRLEPGFFTNSVVMDSEDSVRLSFSRRYNNLLPEIAQQFRFEFTDDSPVSSQSALRTELA